MRIAYINIEDLTCSGGGKVHYWAVAKELRNHGHDIWITAPQYGSTPIPCPEKMRVSSWWTPRKGALGLFWFELMLLFWVPWARAFHKQESWLVRGGGPGFIIGLVFLWARLWGIRVVLECNGISWEEFRTRGFSPWICRWVQFGAWQQIKTANFIIGVSKGIVEACQALGHRKKNDFQVIPNGADPERFTNTSQRQSIRTSLNIPENAIVLGFVGSFAPWHGVQILLDAMSVISNEPFYLLMIGDEKEHLKTQAIKKQLNHVIWIGKVSPEEIPSYFQAMDIGCCLNLANNVDGSPLKFFEYLAAGLFVLGSGFRQVGEILDREKCGVFLDTPDALTIAETLRELQKEPERLRMIRTKNRQIAKERYSWAHVAKLVEAKLQP